MEEKIDSLRRVVTFGLKNGKTNLIVDLDVLAAVFDELDETVKVLINTRNLAAEKIREARTPGPATAGIVAMVRDQVKPLPPGLMEFHETVAAYAPRSLWLRFIAEHEPAS